MEAENPMSDVQRLKKRSKASAPAGETPLGREDWIKAAIVMLAENSVDALRIDDLAKRLGVTKGSFYWHFDTREALLNAVLETWRARTTSDIESYIRHTTGSPSGRINNLLRIAISPRPDVPGGPLELSLRDWARRDANVARVINDVDRERIGFLTRLYIEAGLDQIAAEEMAMAQLAFTIGIRLVMFEGSRDDLERRWKMAKTLFVPSPTE